MKINAKVINEGILEVEFFDFENFDERKVMVANETIKRIDRLGGKYIIHLEDTNLKEYYEVMHENPRYVEVPKISSENGTDEIQNAQNEQVHRQPRFIHKKATTPADIVDRYAYKDEQGSLGLDYDGQKAVFRLWSPFAEYVDVVIYDTHNNVILRRPLKKDGNVWTLTLRQVDLLFDLDRKFYQYYVKNPKHHEKAVLDPYAKSMQVFNMPRNQDVYDKTGKGAIINLKNTSKVDDFAKIEGFKENKDAIVYEVHVRDFTSSPALDSTLNTRFGTFSAFCEKLDYIKDLGVTHIQLLPVMAYYFGIEDNYKYREEAYLKDCNYNWGYDPQSYFSLDGAYSINPRNPYLRIDEFKHLVNEIHRRGMGVVIDVVYTHMVKVDFLSDIVPSYYFFQDEEGRYVGAFGNNIATTNFMAKKLIIDSVRYFLSEFKVDGFRFDMMGDADRQCMADVYQNAKEINPSVLFLGEGWKNFPSHIYGVKGADQDWLSEIDYIGMFSDDYRNLIKSGYGSEGAPRFITNGKVSIQSLFNAIKGHPDNVPNNKSINGIVQYIEAHDNLTLHDAIAIATATDPHHNEIKIQIRLRLGIMLLALSKGLMFVHSGLEYGRTKEWHNTPPNAKHLVSSAGNIFIEDSYSFSDAVNKFDWEFANPEIHSNGIKRQTHDFCQSLIKLRRQDETIRQDGNLKLLPVSQELDNFIAYTIADKYIVVVNADTKDREISHDQVRSIVDMKNYKVVADINGYTDDDSAKQGYQESDGAFVVEALNCVLLKKK